MIVLVCFSSVNSQEFKPDEYPTKGEFVLSDSSNSIYRGMLFNPFEPPTTICIGKYVIRIDSLVTMSKDELDDFMRLINVLSAVILDNKSVDILCQKYIPQRLLNNKAD